MSSRKYFVCLEPGSAPCSKGDDEHDNIEGGTGEEAAADGRLLLACCPLLGLLLGWKQLESSSEESRNPSLEILLWLAIHDHRL
jgi:hypothetical protein